MSNGSPGDEIETRRWPRGGYLLWTIWISTSAVTAIVGFAVWRQLRAGSAPGGQDPPGMHNGDMRGMDPSQMHSVLPGTGSGSALIRLRAEGPLGPLLGPRLLTTWQLDAVAVIALAVVTAWYLSALVLARRRHPDQVWPIGRTLCFLGGVTVCVLATNGSIAVYDMALFSAHMIGHLAFVMVAPALLMTGRPIELALLASGPQMRRRLQNAFNGRVFTLLTAPPVALVSYASVIVGSHLTGLMDSIMRSEWAGQAEHLVYVLIGCQFFIVVLGDAPIRWQLSSPVRWIMLALSMAVDTFTGLVLLQATQPVYMQPMAGLAVNTLTDTRTGGAIMWFAGDGIMAAIMIGLVLGWLHDPERQRRDNASWMEQARRVSFAERTGAVGSHENLVVDDLNFDAEEERLTAYNAWLASLEQQTSQPARPDRSR